MKSAAIRGRFGFTIIEIVAVLALVAVMATFVASGLGGWGAFAGKNKTPERALKIAVLHASAIAREKSATVELTYDPRGFFQIADLETSAVLKRVFLHARTEQKFLEAQKQNVPFDAEPDESDSILFIAHKPEIVGKERIEFPMSDPQRAVFAPDGASNAFSVSITSKSAPQPLVIDFDCMCSTPYETRLK